jgi:hypothetical protein
VPPWRGQYDTARRIAFRLYLSPGYRPCSPAIRLDIPSLSSFPPTAVEVRGTGAACGVAAEDGRTAASASGAVQGSAVTDRHPGRTEEPVNHGGTATEWQKIRLRKLPIGLTGVLLVMMSQIFMHDADPVSLSSVLSIMSLWRP